MVHNTDVGADLARADRVQIVRANLAVPHSLAAAVAGVDTVAHFAGVR